jgi:2-polyprenyl-3-methyl-5-hydroxy-6-metoxy-1,4-benzoquinol methylase
MTSRPEELSPSLFLDTVNAYQRTAVIKAAIQFDVFTMIGGGSETVQRLASKCETSERGMRVLCDCLTVIGFLIKEGRHYRLTPDSAAFLNKQSPAYVADAIEFLLSPILLEGFKDVASAVRKGGTILTNEGTISPENPIWECFARTMAPLMKESAQLITKLVNADPNQKLKILDVAAGHGLFGIAFAQNNQNADITAVDWPNVLEIAKENAQAAGIAERYVTISGNALETEYGYGYDVVLLANFLHHFDIATCELLLTKLHSALAENGRVVTLEFIPDEDRTSPSEAALFSMVMLCSTPNGDAYTFSELAHMFSNAGFSHSEPHDLPFDFGRAVISYK